MKNKRFNEFLKDVKINMNGIIANLGLIDEFGKPLTISSRQDMIRQRLQMNSLVLSQREDDYCCKQKCINDQKLSIFAP